MKNGLLRLFVMGVILTSCSGAPNEEAAKALCDCFEQDQNDRNAAGQAESFSEMMAASQAHEAKMKKCTDAWKIKYDGKIDKEGFKEELKKRDKEIYKEAKKEKLF